MSTAGIFVMGSPDGETPVVGFDGKPKPDSPAPAENARADDEEPQHKVANRVGFVHLNGGRQPSCDVRAV
jgi:hypothetical protein